MSASTNRARRRPQAEPSPREERSVPFSVHADKPGKHLKGIAVYATAAESEEFVLKLSK